MAKFGTEITALGAPDDRSAATIQRPVEDNTVAQAIEFVGKAGLEVAKGKALADLEGGLDKAQDAEVHPDAEKVLPVFGKEVSNAYLTDLSKVAQYVKTTGDVKGGRVHAKRLVTQAKATTLGAMFGAELDAASAQFFGGNGIGGEGGFLGKTPEEKAQEAAREKFETDVQMVMMSTGRRRGEATNAVANQYNLARTAENARNELAIGTTNTRKLTTAATALTAEKSNLIYAKILSAINANGGTLPVKVIQSLELEIHAMEQDITQDLVKVAGDSSVDIGGARAVIDEVGENLRTLMKSQSHQFVYESIVKSLEAENDFLRKTLFGGLDVITGLGSEVTQAYLSAQIDPNLIAHYANDPSTRVMGKLAQPTQQGSGDKPTFTSEESIGLSRLLATTDGAKLFDKMTADMKLAVATAVGKHGAVGSMASFSTPSYVRNAKADWETYEPVIKELVNATAAKIIFDGGLNGSLPPFRIQETVMYRDKPVEIGDRYSDSRGRNQGIVTEEMYERLRKNGSVDLKIISRQPLSNEAKINIKALHGIANAYSDKLLERPEEKDGSTDIVSAEDYIYETLKTTKYEGGEVRRVGRTRRLVETPREETEPAPTPTPIQADPVVEEEMSMKGGGGEAEPTAETPPAETPAEETPAAESTEANPPLDVAKVLNENKGVVFVQRLLYPDKYPAEMLPNGTDYQTHQMSYTQARDGSWIAYPNIILNEDGNLETLAGEEAVQEALDTYNFIKFDTEEEAKFFSEHYKDALSQEDRATMRHAAVKEVPMEIARTLSENAEVPFVQRLMQPKHYSDADMVGEDTTKLRWTTLEDGRTVVFPTIVEKEEFGDVRLEEADYHDAVQTALKNNDYIEVASVGEAKYLVENYQTFRENENNLIDPEYRLDELPKPTSKAEAEYRLDLAKSRENPRGASNAQESFFAAERQKAEEGLKEFADFRLGRDSLPEMEEVRARLSKAMDRVNHISARAREFAYPIHESRMLAMADRELDIAMWLHRAVRAKQQQEEETAYQQRREEAAALPKKKQRTKKRGGRG
jgi:hypothetical protein